MDLLGQTCSDRGLEALTAEAAELERGRPHWADTRPTAEHNGFPLGVSASGLAPVCTPAPPTTPPNSGDLGALPASGGSSWPTKPHGRMTRDLPESLVLAEGVGFEPTVGRTHNGFRDRSR